MKRIHTMIAAGATLSVLTLPWAAAAQQPSAPTETKVQRLREMVKDHMKTIVGIQTRSEVGIDRENATIVLVQDLSERLAVSPVDAGEDVDADWQRPQSSGWRRRPMPRSSHRTKF